MNTFSFRTLFVILSVQRQVGALIDFSTCHDDFGLKPPDGVLRRNTFGWLGFVQYMHIITGLPHQRKAPRIMLIQKQYIIGTATDLLQLPVNYKMGNVIFGEYEREESDCGLTLAQINMGKKCPHAYLEIPILAITAHPEYTSFGVGNSLALAKLIRPLKSGYMMPICMPSIGERMKKRKNKFVFMVDYISTVPTDFDVERMGKKTLELLTHEECRRHRLRARLGSEGVTHMLCSSGCGVRSGAPIVSQNMEGAFELIGIAAGGALCGQSSHREHLIKEPPLYIDVYPYARWLVNVISAHELPLPYPSNFRTFDGASSMGIRANYLRWKVQKSGWIGRTYLTGNFCHRNKKRQWKSGFFYAEEFQVNLKPNTLLTVNMTISAGIQCTIICVRLLLPNKLISPEIKGVGGSNISIYIQTDMFPSVSNYTLGLLGKNTSQLNLELLKSHLKPGWW